MRTRPRRAPEEGPSGCGNESRETAAFWAGGTPPGRLGRTGERSRTDRLGWVDLPLTAADTLPDYRALRRELLAEGFERLFVVAMGGSGRSPETLVSVLPQRDGLEVRFLDGLAPESVREALAPGSLSRSVFLIASKSGTTVETRALEALVVRALEASGRAPARQLMALSDPGSPLLAAASAAGYRRVFAGLPNVGGRFSALGRYGLLPAVLGGCEVEEALAAAREVRRALDAPSPPEADPGIRLGIRLAALYAAGRSEAHLSASPEFAAVLPWLEQLFAENTGKGDKGILPVILPPPPRPPGFGRRVFLIHLGPAAGDDGGRLAAAAAEGVPVIHAVPVPGTVLGEMFRWQVATSVAAFRMGLDPYSEPDVEDAKAAARRLLRDPGRAEPPPPVTDGCLAAFLRASVAGGLAINAFGHRSAAAEAAVGRARRSLAERFGVVPALGFGSALLHSLGQIEKGGPPDLSVLVLHWGPEEDLEIPPAEALPPAPPGLGAGTFVRLQATADRQELRRRGRRVLWLEAPAPGERGLAALLARLDPA